MLRRRHINAGPVRGMRAAAEYADRARWPFERFAWLLERRLLWPLGERVAGWIPSGNVAAATGLAALAAIAVAIGVLWPSGSGRSTERAAPAAVAIATPQPRPQAKPASGAALHGAAPSFGLGKGVGVAKRRGAAASSHGAPAAPSGAIAGEGEGKGASEGGEAAATASSTRPVPAGPAAMKAARRFAQAFVYYEIGKRPAHAKAVFGETATPRLAATLAERPPRLPKSVKVPKARVVNLVPGPRRGKAYTVSVSLLRVGVTSELRLTLQPGKAGDWKVAEILG